MLPGSEAFASDDAGATEVIGVVLMVAVTVVLASAAAVPLESYTGAVTAYPLATFAFDHTQCDKGETLEVTHLAGDAVNASELYLRSPDLHLTGSWADPHGYEVSGADDGKIEAGDTARICGGSFDDATVRVVWKSGDGESIVLGTWRKS
jgi:flagellin-like protein